VVAKRKTDRAEHDADARPACTLQFCPTFDVKRYLHQLRQTLPCVPPIPVRELTSLHTSRDYEGMVRLIKKTMNVEVRLVVAWVNSGGPPGMKDAPAWIELPLNMPFYGTKAFRELKLTMFIRKSFLVESKYDQAAIVVAHELSHVVLESIRHPLRGCEKAVDLTAMLLGFRQLYASGSYKEERSGNSTRSRKLGYLSLEEVQLANRILAPGVDTQQDDEEGRKRRRRATEAARDAGERCRRRSKINVIPFMRAMTVQRKALLPLLVVGVVAAFGAKELYRAWDVHQTLLTWQVNVQKQLPKKLDADTTVIGVRVGFTTWTYLYSVPKPGNLSVFERELREVICADNRAIDDGVSYSHEYRDQSGALLVRFETSSC
jgi:hypothetical protein